MCESTCPHRKSNHKSQLYEPLITTFILFLVIMTEKGLVLFRQVLANCM